MRSRTVAKLREIRKRLQMMPSWMDQLFGANWDASPAWGGWPGVTYGVVGAPPDRLQNRGNSRVWQSSYRGDGTWYATAQFAEGSQPGHVQGVVSVDFERVPGFAYGGQMEGVILEQRVDGNNRLSFGITAGILSCNLITAGSPANPSGWTDLDLTDYEGDFFVGYWRRGDVVTCWAASSVGIVEGTFDGPSAAGQLGVDLGVMAKASGGSKASNVHLIEAGGLLLE